MKWPLKIPGRRVKLSEVMKIVELIASNPSWDRTRLSQELCKSWNWYRTDGQMKDMACRELLRKLEKHKIIKLPKSQRAREIKPRIIEPVEYCKEQISCRLSEVQPIKLVDVRINKAYANSFNYFLKEYHYLSYNRPVGQNMQYMILDKYERIIGCFLFGAAA